MPSYDSLVYFAKSWGLIYLMVIFLGAVLYAFWPGKQKTFDRAAKSILDEDDRPCR